jgi:hypothetical protein
MDFQLFDSKSKFDLNLISKLNEKIFEQENVENAVEVSGLEEEKSTISPDLFHVLVDNFEGSSSHSHLKLILFCQNINIQPQKFILIFNKTCEFYLSLTAENTAKNSKSVDFNTCKLLVVGFLLLCFNNINLDFIRSCCLKLINITTWKHLSSHRLELELLKPEQARLFQKACKKSNSQNIPDFYHSFFTLLFKDFFKSVLSPDFYSNNSFFYCVKVLELMIDLESQLWSRRFFNVLFNDSHFMLIVGGILNQFR